MKRLAVASLPLVLLIANCFDLPALSKPADASAQSNQRNTRLVKLPVSTALIVELKSAIETELSQVQNQPLTLALSQPIIDEAGKVAAPAGALVVGQLTFKGNGIQIVLNSIVMGNRVVPIQASGSAIPTQTITRQSQSEENQNAADNVYRAAVGATGIAGAVGGYPAASRVGGAGAGLSVLAGLVGANKPRTEKVSVVKIPAGSIYVFALEQPITVSLPVESERSLNQTPTSASQRNSQRTTVIPPTRAIYPGTFALPQQSDGYPYGGVPYGGENRASTACAEYEAQYRAWRQIRDYRNQNAGSLGAQGLAWSSMPAQPIRPPQC